MYVLSENWKGPTQNKNNNYLSCLSVSHGYNGKITSDNYPKIDPSMAKIRKNLHNIQIHWKFIEIWDFPEILGAQTGRCQLLQTVTATLKTSVFDVNFWFLRIYDAWYISTKFIYSWYHVIFIKCHSTSDVKGFNHIYWCIEFVYLDWIRFDAIWFNGSWWDWMVFDGNS